jgi:hypothetical protein
VSVIEVGTCILLEICAVHELHLFALSRSKSVPTRDSHVAQNPSPLFAELGEGEGHAANSDVENQHNEQLIDFFGRHLSYHEPASARG